MSRPGASEPKNWATNNLRNGLVSQVAGGLLFRFWVTQTNRIGCQIMRLHSRLILLAFIQSHLISFLLDRKSMNFWSKVCDTGVSAEDAELAQNQIQPPALSKDRTKTSLC